MGSRATYCGLWPDMYTAHCPSSPQGLVFPWTLCALCSPLGRFPLIFSSTVPCPPPGKALGNAPHLAVYQNGAHEELRSSSCLSAFCGRDEAADTHNLKGQAKVISEASVHDWLMAGWI